MTGSTSKAETPGEAAATPAPAVSTGGSHRVPRYRDNVVGRRLKIYWPHNHTWPIGHIKAYHPANGRHTLLFENGDNKTYILHKEKYQFLPEDSNEVTGDDMVGKSVLVWWADDTMWYHGTIDSYDGYMHGIMYDDGQHEFLYLDMHDFQLCEGGAPKEQPAAPAQPKQMKGVVDPKATIPAGEGRVRNRSNSNRHRDRHRATVHAAGAAGVRAEGWVHNRMDMKDREAASVLLGFTAPPVDEEGAAATEQPSTAAEAAPSSSPGNTLEDTSAAAGTAAAGGTAAAAAGAGAAAVDAGYASGSGRAALGLRARPRQVAASPEPNFDVDSPAVAPSRAACHGAGSLGGLVPPPTRRQRTGYPIGGSIAGASKILGLSAGLCSGPSGLMLGSGQALPGLPNMTQQHGSTSNAVAAAAAAAAAAAGVGWQGRAGGGGLLSAMEELLKHVKEVEAKQALEVAKRKTAEAERDVALTKLRAAQEELAAARSGGISSRFPSDFQTRDMLDISTSAAALSSQATAAALHQQLLQMTQVVAQVRQDSNFALAQVRELTSELTSMRSAEGAAAVAAVGGVAVGGGPLLHQQPPMSPLPRGAPSPSGAEGTCSGGAGGSLAAGAAAAAMQLSGWELPAAMAVPSPAAETAAAVATPGRKPGRVKTEEPDSALLDADGQQQQQRDQTVGAPNGMQQQDAEQADSVQEGQQQQQQQAAAGSVMSGGVRASLVANGAPDHGGSCSGEQLPEEVQEGGAAAPAFVLPPAMLGGSTQANGAYDSSATALLSAEDGAAATGSIFSASAAGLASADGAAAAGASAAVQAGSQGAAASPLLRPANGPTIVSSPERVCAKRTRAHLVVPTEPAGDNCGAAGAEEEAPGASSRKLPRRGEAAAPGGGAADGPVLVGPV